MRQLPILASQNPPAALPAPVDDRWWYPFIRITASSFDAAAAASGSHSVFFAKVSGETRRYLTEVVALHPLAARGINGEVYACGRSVIAALSTTDASTSFSSAVANATLSAKANQLKVATRGIAVAATGKMIALSGKQIDANGAKEFGEGLGAIVDWCVRNAKETGIESRPGAVFQLVGREPRPLRTATFTLNRIAEGDPLGEALRVLAPSPKGCERLHWHRSARRCRGLPQTGHRGAEQAECGSTPACRRCDGGRCPHAGAQHRPQSVVHGGPPLRERGWDGPFASEAHRFRRPCESRRVAPHPG